MFCLRPVLVYRAVDPFKARTCLPGPKQNKAPHSPGLLIPVFGQMPRSVLVGVDAYVLFLAWFIKTPNKQAQDHNSFLGTNHLN